MPTTEALTVPTLPVGHAMAPAWSELGAVLVRGKTRLIACKTFNR